MLIAKPEFKNKRPPMPINMLISQLIMHNKYKSNKLSLTILVDTVDELVAIQNYLFTFPEICWGSNSKECKVTHEMRSVIENDNGPLMLTLNYYKNSSSKLTYSSARYPENIDDLGLKDDNLDKMFLPNGCTNYYILFSDYFKVQVIDNEDKKEQ